VIPTGLLEEIERQIDETRHALDRTLRALQFELSPRHQIEAVWRSTGRSLRTGANWATANSAAIALGALVLVATATAFTIASRQRQRR
jgi:cell division protein FtsX